MCNPVIPAVIGTGLQMVSGALNADDDANDGAEEAQRLRERGAREAARVQRDNLQARSQQRVSLLRGGVTDSGSATDVLMDAAQEGARDVYWVRHGYEAEARAKERAARRARRSGILDQLGAMNGLGGNIIDLENSGKLYQ